MRSRASARPARAVHQEIVNSRQADARELTKALGPRQIALSILYPPKKDWRATTWNRRPSDPRRP